MSTLTYDQRFVLLLIIGMVSGTWLSIGTTAQTFTSEDRGSILKFMDVLLNFLDAESDNATSTENPINNGTTTTTDNVESSTLSTTASNATESTTLSSESTEATSNSTTTLATNATETSSTTDPTSTTVANVVPTRRRICFKRVCYKFASDKGYIY
ncbi:hypothetical protein ACLKA6_010324 [Drosophila palustris]